MTLYFYSETKEDIYETSTETEKATHILLLDRSGSNHPVKFPIVSKDYREEYQGGGLGTFLEMIEQKQVATVELDGNTIYFTDKEAETNFYETTTFDDPDLVNRLDEAGCTFGRVAEEPMNPILSFLLSWIVPLLQDS